MENGQNPFTVPVAMLLYRVARSMKHSSESPKPGTIRALLKNCLYLLSREKYPQVGISLQSSSFDLYSVCETRVYCVCLSCNQGISVKQMALKVVPLGTVARYFWSKEKWKNVYQELKKNLLQFFLWCPQDPLSVWTKLKPGLVKVSRTFEVYGVPKQHLPSSRTPLRLGAETYG